MLLGLPPTDAEVQAVETNSLALPGLVDQWMRGELYEGKIRRFFELAFQQTQISPDDFVHQVQGELGFNPVATAFLLQNIQESFARTQIELNNQGRPLTDAMTTREFMMTTALKEFYAFLDSWDVDNQGAVTDAYRVAHRNQATIVEAALGPIPIEQTLDPASPNYMHWYDPDVGGPQMETAGCKADPVSLAPDARSLHYLLLGSIDGRTLRTGQFCQLTNGTGSTGQFAPSDFSDWSLVSIRRPNAGEPTTVFYDLPALRNAKELVLDLPRVGFFTTPAFFANWQTNDSNQMRATINQALIVATGSSVDGTDQTLAPGTPGLNAAHANQAACFNCHKILDPTRSIFSSTFSWNYHHQTDPEWSSEPGVFAFRGVIAPVTTLDEFGAVLAHHPLVAPAFAQKLCFYVNSAPCDDTDPEFKRIVALFRESGMSFNALVKALVTSPITTHSADTATTKNQGEIVAVARRDHLCAALDARLGFSDVCGLSALNAENRSTVIPAVASGLPSDAYGRGAVAPILPNHPSLFFASGVENICEAVASLVVDPAPGAQPASERHWSSADPYTAIADFVSVVMGLTSGDPRSIPARDLLATHFSSALAETGVSATDALRSTFIVACLAPSALAIGL